MNGWVWMNNEWRFYPDLGVQRRLCLENLSCVLLLRDKIAEWNVVEDKLIEMRLMIGPCKVLTLKEYDNG